MRNSVDVHNFLVERDVHHEVFSVRGRLRSPERIASVLDLPPDCVGRVIVLETEGGPVAALVPAGRRADPGAVARALNAERVTVAGPNRASQLTEYLAEAIPPAGLPPGFSVVMHRSLAPKAVLYFPGGEATAILKVRGEELARATGARVASIVA